MYVLTCIRNLFLSTRKKRNLVCYYCHRVTIIRVTIIRIAYGKLRMRCTRSQIAGEKGLMQEALV